jgi:hypothetical protein
LVGVCDLARCPSVADGVQYSIPQTKLCKDILDNAMLACYAGTGRISAASLAFIGMDVWALLYGEVCHATHGSGLRSVSTCVYPPQTSVAGENPNVKLAMHVIASADSLGWDDLIPAACESINVDISVEELLAAGGYGYIVLLAYDVEGITGIEFALSGWPTGRGAPLRVAQRG